VVCALVGAVFLLGGLWRRSRTEPAPAWLSALFLALAWCALDLLGALAGGRNYRHYFLAMVASLCVVAGVVAWRAFLDARGAVAAKFAFAALLILPLAHQQFRELQLLNKLVRGAKPPDPWMEVASRLRAVKRPGDTLMTWSFQPEIFLVAGMRSPYRVLDPHYRHDSPRAFRTFGTDLARQIRERPPTFVVLGPRTSGGASPGTTVDWVEEKEDAYLRDFKGWLEPRYDLILEAGYLRLYRLKEGGVSPA
jgi:hypothetical protein